VALLCCGLVVFSPLPLSVRSAPSSWRRCGVDALQLGGWAAWDTQAHRLRWPGPFPIEQDGWAVGKINLYYIKYYSSINYLGLSLSLPVSRRLLCDTYAR
jgi:hypothetical protein